MPFTENNILQVENIMTYLASREGSCGSQLYESTHEFWKVPLGMGINGLCSQGMMLGL